jgi:hypothetical protein
VRAWERIVAVNLLAHVWAARAVLPRGGGYLLQTISSAALITGPSGPGYTMTKHGALGEVLMPEDVAGTVIEGMDAERFLILPHPRVGNSFRRKGADYDAWLSRTRERLLAMRPR